MTFLKKLRPTSLFARLIIVFFTGLFIILAISVALNHEERERLLQQLGSQDAAYRIADTVNLLDSLSEQEREHIVQSLNVPPQMVMLRKEAVSFIDAPNVGMSANRLLEDLRYAIGDQKVIHVRVRAPLSQENIEIPEECLPRGHMRQRGMMGGMRRGWEGNAHHMGMMRSNDNPVCDPLPMYNYDPNIATAYFVQVQLDDGAWVTFDTLIFHENLPTPARLLLTLLFVFLGISLLVYMLVRWVTRPLKVLADEANALGVDINKPPIPERGPDETKRAAQAFNTMQERLKSLIQDRTHIFAAMSHDLKTPITRLRLRAELLEDDVLRASFEKDLKEMESMVKEALSFMKGIDSSEKSQPVDINALLESLQEDYQEMGKTVSLKGRANAPLVAVASLIKRCLSNLIDNAIFYGEQAHIDIYDNPQQLTITIKDNGPGIPEEDQKRVFDPFFRLEQSRNRATGGTGLGLPLVRNIAHLHGGKVTLRNAEQGGLEVTLTLPRVNKN